MKKQTRHFKKAETDESGLDKTYASSDHFHLDVKEHYMYQVRKGGIIGKEWMEHYRSFGVPLVAKMLDFDPLAQTTYDVTQMDRYQQLDQFMKDNPDKVKNFVGHSKGSAVIDQWMKNNPDFKGKARLYSTPYDDPFGTERIKDWLNDSRKQRNDYYKDKSWVKKIGNTIQDTEQDLLEHITGFDKITGMKEGGQTRIANNQDFAAVLDNSAERYDHPNPFAYLKQGGQHDYHEGVAAFTSGFDNNLSEGALKDRPGEIDPNYRTLQ